MGKYEELIHVRLSNSDLEFIDMISRKAKISRSDAVRLAIWMLRIILSLEAVDVDKVTRAFQEAHEKAIKEVLMEEWNEVVKGK